MCVNGELQEYSLVATPTSNNLMSSSIRINRHILEVYAKMKINYYTLKYGSMLQILLSKKSHMRVHTLCVHLQVFRQAKLILVVKFRIVAICVQESND